MLPLNVSKVHVPVFFFFLKAYYMYLSLYIRALCMYAVHVAKRYTGNHAATIGSVDETMT